MKTLENNYKFLLTTNDFDYKEHLRPSAVLNYFQVAAGMHATELGVGFDDFIVRNLAWILVKVKYKTIRDPKLDTNINVITWPKEPRRVEHDRLYSIIDDNGNILFEGLSRWCVIDFTSRKISREKDFYTGIFSERDNSLNFNNDIIKLNDLSELQYKFDYVVRLADLDHNGHMNNTKYGDIVLSVTEKGKHIEEFEINFINECLLEDVISVYEKVIDEHTLFVLAFNNTKNKVSFKSLVKYSK